MNIEETLKQMQRQIDELRELLRVPEAPKPYDVVTVTV